VLALLWRIYVVVVSAIQLTAVRHFCRWLPNTGYCILHIFEGALIAKHICEEAIIVLAVYKSKILTNHCIYFNLLLESTSQFLKNVGDGGE